MTELLAKFSCEMSVVAKTAGVGDLAQRLARAQQRPALQKARGEEKISTRLSMRGSWRHSCAVPTRGLSTTCWRHARKPEGNFAPIRGSLSEDSGGGLRSSSHFKEYGFRVVNWGLYHMWTPACLSGLSAPYRSLRRIIGENR